MHSKRRTTPEKFDVDDLFDLSRRSDITDNWIVGRKSLK